MTQMQFTASLDADGQLVLEYDPQQLQALGLRSLPQLSQMRFKARTDLPRPSFGKVAGLLGELGRDEMGNRLDAVQFVREVRGQE